MSDFKDAVLLYISKIPRGKVVSYGQVAAACGSPRAARQVGGILKAFDGENELPWWRVVNSEGRLSIKGNWTATKQLQKHLLEKEGVKVDQNFQLNIAKYRFKFTKMSPRHL